MIRKQLWLGKWDRFRQIYKWSPLYRVYFGQFILPSWLDGDLPWERCLSVWMSRSRRLQV